MFSSLNHNLSRIIKPFKIKSIKTARTRLNFKQLTSRKPHQNHYVALFSTTRSLPTSQSSSTPDKMPLVVPGINSNDSSGGDQTQQWMQKLVGKKITESGNTDETSFAKKDLPSQHRVLGPDSMATMDFNKDRLNVHTDKDGTVRKVTHG